LISIWQFTGTMLSTKKVLVKKRLSSSQEESIQIKVGTSKKFKGEVHKIIVDSEHCVKYEVNIVDRPKVLSLKEEEEINKKLKQSHESMKENLTGIDKPMIKMTSKRTYSSKDGEKFSGNLYIGGNCPSDLKDNFIKYYNEVAKPIPEDYALENQARLRSEPSRPVISCGICKSSLDDKQSFFGCLTCKDRKSETNVCDECVKNEKGLSDFVHAHPLVLIPKNNELRSQVSKRHVPSSLGLWNEPSSMSLWRDEPIFKDVEKEFGAMTKQLMPEFDSFTRGWLSATEPLNQRFRQFERIADRIDRNLRSSFNRPFSLFDDNLFPFESRNMGDTL